jgi:hypothetical protein
MTVLIIPRLGNMFRCLGLRKIYFSPTETLHEHMVPEFPFYDQNSAACSIPSTVMLEAENPRFKISMKCWCDFY